MITTVASDRADIRLPSSERSPLMVLLQRLGSAAGLVLVVSVLTYLDRDGFRDATGDEIDLLDAFYFGAVSVTSTGYGDITHSVVVSSGAAGRLLGHAVKSPRVVQVLEDLLSVGAGLDVLEREVTREEVGLPLGSVPESAPIIAVVRGQDVLRFDDPRVDELRAGDRLVCLSSNPG